MTEKVAVENPNTEAPITFVEFLESVPPNTLTTVTSLFHIEYSNGGFGLSTQDIQLHCSNDSCNGLRFFSCGEESIFVPKLSKKNLFLEYVCRNCCKQRKVFAISIFAASKSQADVMKFGEFPSYGPPTPARMIKMIGPDRDIFLKGRQCENQGLGIGAFTYYRRVVQNQWSRLVDSILNVANQIGAPKEMVASLNKAKSDFRFTKSVEDTKDAIPANLLINGHNPLTLLYSALSEGVHDLSDEECLEIASSVRVILSELSDKISNALKDEKEIKDAVTRLLTKKVTSSKPEREGNGD